MALLSPFNNIIFMILLSTILKFLERVPSKTIAKNNKRILVHGSRFGSRRKEDVQELGERRQSE